MTEVIEKNENKKGYKKTKLGWIPEDWEIYKIGDFGTFKNGISKGGENFGYGTPIIGLNDVFDKYYITKNNPNSLVNATTQELLDFNLKKGDVLFVRSSVKPEGVGMPCVVEANLEKTTFSGFLIRFRDKEGLLNNKFKRYCFLLEYFRHKLLAKSTISANTNINQPSLSSLNVIIPCLKEQEKIAEILSAWDDGIETLEKLIEQKEVLKNSLAQKYFHRKNNLFQLKQHKLGELFKNRKETNCCDLELLSVCDGLGIVPRSQLNAKDNSNEDKSKYLKVCVGDLAYNTMRMWQGRCGVSSYEGIVSPAYTVCIPKDNIDVDYMYYLFKTPHMIHDFWRYSQGIVDDTLNLKFNNFEVIKVWISDKETQTKIAKLLKSYDEEIQILNSKLEKLKEQKKGLMQKLLTGQIRVKI